MDKKEILTKVQSALSEIDVCTTFFREKAVALGTPSGDLYPEKLFRSEMLRVLSFLDSKEPLSVETLGTAIDILNTVHKDLKWNLQTLRESLDDYKRQNSNYASVFLNDQFPLPTLLEAAREYDLRNETMLFDRFSQLLFQIWNLLIKADGKITSDEEKFLLLYNSGTILKKSKEKDHEFSRQLTGIYDDFFGYTERLQKGIEERKSNPSTVSGEEKKPPPPQEEEKSLEELMEELNSLVGLESVKSEINNLINVIKIEKIRKEKGLAVPDKSLHLVFTGNPGTGKTTIGRFISKIYKSLGVLSKGHLVETDRSGLVAGFVGQTAAKTLEICQSALDGVLFIDEAYALAEGGENDFGREAINTLLKFMEDNRSRIIVIVAGYTDNMESFIDKNPGLKSRFNKYIQFEDYSPEELVQIFERISSKMKLNLSEPAKEKLREKFQMEYDLRDKTFGNGRLARNIFEKAYMNQANRLVKITDLTEEALCTILPEDLMEIGIETKPGE